MNYETTLKRKFSTEKHSQVTSWFFPTCDLFMTYEPSNNFGRSLFGNRGREVQQAYFDMIPMPDFERDTKHVKPVTVSSELTQLLDEEKACISYQDAGIVCDYTAHMLGEDNCMIAVDMEMHQRHVIYIAVPISAALHLEANQFLIRGAALMHIIEGFQSQGVDVGLIAFDGTQSDGMVDFQVVQVKAPQDDINKTAVTRLLSDRRICTNIALSRGMDNLQTHGARDVNLTVDVLAQAHPHIDAETVMIISSSESHALVEKPQEIAQELYDSAASRLAEQIKAKRAQ